MKTLWYYGVAGEFQSQKILADIEKQKPQRIVLFGETEWELSDIGIDFANKCLENKLKLVIVHGCFKSQYHNDYYNKFPKNLDLEVIFWGTYWFNFAEWCVSNRYHGYETMPHKNDFKYPFLNMNCRAHVHRCSLIDELARKDLINKGKVSWHDHLEENQSFKFKYFDRKNKLRLGDEFETKLDSILIPDCYYDTFMVLVTEATTKAHFVTEKTVMPLLLKRPHLVIAGKDHNKKLFELGFLPYDDIFDYSFDNVDDLFERTRLAVENVERICEADWKLLYTKIQDKLDYNQKLAIQITKDHRYIPEIAKEKIELNRKGLATESTIDLRFVDHLKRCEYLN